MLTILRRFAAIGRTTRRNGGGSPPPPSPADDWSADFSSAGNAGALGGFY